MNVSVTDPISRAFEQMRAFLFRPFDISRWLHVGFGAWLVSLTEGGASMNFPSESFSGADGSKFVQEALRSLGEADLASWAAIGAGFFAAVLVLGAILTWLSARGRFMLLDNLVHERAEVRAPWHEFRPEAWSLFVWSFVVGLLALLVLGSGLVVLVAGIVRLFTADLQIPANVLEWLPQIAVSELFALGTVLFAAGLASAVTFALLHDFVVVLMWKHRLTTTAAWQRFLPILKARAGAFAAFLLLKIVLYIGVGILIMIAALATCCIGLVLLYIPYVNSVLLLPITTAFRYYDLYFLAQFGPDFDPWQGIERATSAPDTYEPPSFEASDPDPDNPYAPSRS